MKGFFIFMFAMLVAIGAYAAPKVGMISKELQDLRSHKNYTTQKIAHIEELLTDKEKKELASVPDYSFCYLEFTAFPTRIEDNTFGIALGYRVSEGENSASDYAFHVMRNACKEIIIAGKANHLFYALEKKNTFAPYMGFGLIFGVAPEKYERTKLEQHYADQKDPKLEYALMMDGELCAGVEYKLNNNTRQFFELTYYAHTAILQLSLGLGF